MGDELIAQETDQRAASTDMGLSIVLPCHVHPGCAFPRMRPGTTRICGDADREWPQQPPT